MQTQFEQSLPLSVDWQVKRTRDRQTQRTVSVLAPGEEMEPDWVGVERIVRVERVGTRANEPYAEAMFYISSLQLDATGFAERVRSHWHVENRLHWPKDVVLREDESPLCDVVMLLPTLRLYERLR